MGAGNGELIKKRINLDTPPLSQVDRTPDKIFMFLHNHCRIHFFQWHNKYQLLNGSLHVRCCYDVLSVRILLHHTVTNQSRTNNTLSVLRHLVHNTHLVFRLHFGLVANQHEITDTQIAFTFVPLLTYNKSRRDLSTPLLPEYIGDMTNKSVS